MEDKKENKILEFGIQRENEVEVFGGCGIIFDPESKMFAVGEHDDNGLFRLFSGGVKEGEGIKEGVLREVEEESGLYDFSHIEKIAEARTHFYNSLKGSNRVGYSACFLLILKSRSLKPTRLEAHEKFSLVWVNQDKLLANWHERNKEKDLDHWFYFFNQAVDRIKELGYVL